MRHLYDYGRFLGVLVLEFGCLEEVVIVKTIAETLLQVSLGGENDNFLEWSVLCRLPEGLELLLSLSSSTFFIFIGFERLPFELHIEQYLC